MTILEYWNQPETEAAEDTKARRLRQLRHSANSLILDAEGELEEAVQAHEAFIKKLVSDPAPHFGDILEHIKNVQDRERHLNNLRSVAQSLLVGTTENETTNKES